MAIKNLRLLAQHLSFLLLIYGGRLGIHLGSALPCFACPFVVGCGGYCYLMGLQGYIGFGMALSSLWDIALLRALAWLALFIVLVALLGKTWCGWICPFGLLQDWFSLLRARLGIRESHFSPRTQQGLAPIKYLLLIYLVVIPPLITAGILSMDFHYPFCNICPGKSLLPLFVGETRYLALNVDNTTTLVFSSLLILITGIMLVGMFFKRRFFCVFCPLLALVHLLKPLTLFRLVKDPSACIGCGTCRRCCPMDIETVSLEKHKTDVQVGSCINCADCADNCPSPGALNLQWSPWLTIFSSSRDHLAKHKPLTKKMAPPPPNPQEERRP
ncbi:MAG: 4Fe-4S binding protein [Desulfobulbus sp.]|jgi:ferredoxin-type protein NapH